MDEHLKNNVIRSINDLKNMEQPELQTLVSQCAFSFTMINESQNSLSSAERES